MISDDVEYNNLCEAKILDDCSSYESEELNIQAVKSYNTTKIIKKKVTSPNNNFPQESNSCIFGKTNNQDTTFINNPSSGIIKKKFVIHNNTGIHNKSRSVNHNKKAGVRHSLDLEMQKFNQTNNQKFNKTNNQKFDIKINNVPETLKFFQAEGNNSPQDLLFLNKSQNIIPALNKKTTNNVPESLCNSQILEFAVNEGDNSPKDLIFFAKSQNNIQTQNNKIMRGFNNNNYQTSTQETDYRASKGGNYYIKKAANGQFDGNTTNKGFEAFSSKNKIKSLNFIKRGERLRNQLKPVNNYHVQDTKQLTNMNLINNKKGDISKNGCFFTEENKTLNELEKRPVFISKKGKNVKGDTLVIKKRK